MEDNGAEYDLKIAIIQSKADARCLQEALKVKDLEMRVAQQINDVEMKASAKIWDAERQAMQHVNDVELKAKDAEARATVNEEARKAVERAKDAEVRAAVNEEARKAAEERAAHIERETEAKVQQAVANAVALKERDMELANLRRQLELVKTRNSANGEGGSLLGGNPGRKRTHENMGGRGAGVQEENIDGSAEEPGPIKSSPLLTMTPYDDPVEYDSNRAQRRRWVVAYASDKVLETSDFADGFVRHTTATSFGNGEFLTMLTFSRRVRLTVVQPVMQELRSKGRITGQVLVETCFKATLRFDVSAVTNGSIRLQLMRSPSRVRMGGVLGCRMIVVG